MLGGPDGIEIPPRLVVCVIVRPATVSVVRVKRQSASSHASSWKNSCRTGLDAEPVGSTERARTGLIMRMMSVRSRPIAGAAANRERCRRCMGPDRRDRP